MNFAQISPSTRENDIQIIEKRSEDKVTVTFTGLNSSEEYKVTIFTVINGKKIHTETETIVARDVAAIPSLPASPNVDKEDNQLTSVSFDNQTDKVVFSNCGYDDSD